MLSVVVVVVINLSFVSKHCDQHVCLSVCLLARFQNHTSKFHHVFCTRYLWPWRGPFSDSNAISYVLRVLSFTSCFDIVERTERTKADAHVSSTSPAAAPGAKSAVSDCILLVLHIVLASWHNVLGVGLAINRS